MTTNTTPTKAMKISLSQPEIEMAMFLMKQKNQPSIQSLLRFILAMTYSKEKDNNLKYAKVTKGVSRKQELEETISNIKAMDIEELEAYLLEIGYFQEDHEDPENSNTILKDRIYEYINLEGLTEFKTAKIRDSGIQGNYESDDCMSLDAIIRDLIKQKLI